MLATFVHLCLFSLLASSRCLGQVILVKEPVEHYIIYGRPAPFRYVLSNIGDKEATDIHFTDDILTSVDPENPRQSGNDEKFTFTFKLQKMLPNSRVAFVKTVLPQVNARFYADNVLVSYSIEDENKVTVYEDKRIFKVYLGSKIDFSAHNGAWIVAITSMIFIVLIPFQKFMRIRSQRFISESK
ncbi:MAG: hypothetical protein MHMPM18_001753 [Marteilia pararefringens]